MIQFDEHIFQMGGSTTNQFRFFQDSLRNLGRRFLLSFMWNGSTGVPQVLRPMVRGLETRLGTIKKRKRASNQRI